MDVKKCERVWQDVFLTKPEYAADEFDDIEVAPVMSVHIEVNALNQYVATPATGGTDWLMHGFVQESNTIEQAEMGKIQVGDMIRVGTGGATFTDYLTVLEIVELSIVRNMMGEPFQLGDTNGGASVIADGTTYPTSGVMSEPAEARRAFRVNQSIDATSLPTLNGADWPTSGWSFQGTAGGFTASTFATRHRSFFMANGATHRFYPMYRQRKYTSSTRPTRSVLQMQMPTFIKQVCAVKLVGYSMIHKRHVGVQQQHEAKEDDWFALRIKEVNGDVLSNNAIANGAFHILHAANTGVDTEAFGSVRLHEYDADGLATTEFTPKNLPSLTIDVTDRMGDEAHFGRMHLWLKVLVTKA